MKGNGKNGKFRSLTKQNFQKLISLKGNYENVSITFRNHDKTYRVLKTNPLFFKNNAGRLLTVTKIIENINALKHDMSAKEYIIH